MDLGAPLEAECPSDGVVGSSPTASAPPLSRSLRNIRLGVHILPNGIRVYLFSTEAHVALPRGASSITGWFKVANVLYMEGVIHFLYRAYEGHECVEAFLTPSIGKAKVCTRCPWQLNCLSMK